MAFNEALKAIRIAKGFTQQQVADILEITKGTYSGYETGRREPDVFKIKALANLFGVSGVNSWKQDSVLVKQNSHPKKKRT